MKVKIINSSGFTGLGEALGSVVASIKDAKGRIFVLGSELIKAGASPNAFDSQHEYCFSQQDIEVEEES